MEKELTGCVRPHKIVRVWLPKTVRVFVDEVVVVARVVLVAAAVVAVVLRVVDDVIVVKNDPTAS